ncbi:MULTISPECIES: phosphoribosyl-AMP cyclohydrolase [Rhodomicrobium]|uniref:phosphoribosyl-AMP cyclohydrolase n=1 Tax=Rhodomicrobium TaxID=1068 RepID=UPI000B4A6CBC|nr:MULTISPECIES: phosphoribosyl-AMP cyclohydrolase [Rhodomicrobium]
MSAPTDAPSKLALESGTDFTPRFDGNGLLAAIVAEASSGDVLMFAYMNADALARTLETGEAHFWSRSRGALWRKGESSGNVLRVVEMRTDCDQDCLLLRVELTGGGAACHTGRKSCFYRRVELGRAKTEGRQLSFLD